jgi:hypothetical protein
MKNRYLLLSLALLASGTTLVAMDNNPPSKRIASANNSCAYCDKSFATSGNLIRHIETVHRGTQYSCAYCDLFFTKKGKLKKHIDAVHNEYPCTYCNKFFTQNNLIRHIEQLPACVDYPSCQYRALDDTQLTEHLQEHQQMINNTRLLDLLATSTHVQSSFSAETLLNMNRK